METPLFHFPHRCHQLLQRPCHIPPHGITQQQKYGKHKADNNQNRYGQFFRDHRQQTDRFIRQQDQPRLRYSVIGKNLFTENPVFPFLSIRHVPQLQLILFIPPVFLQKHFSLLIHKTKSLNVIGEVLNTVVKNILIHIDCQNADRLLCVNIVDQPIECKHIRFFFPPERPFSIIENHVPATSRPDCFLQFLSPEIVRLKVNGLIPNLNIISVQSENIDRLNLFRYREKLIDRPVRLRHQQNILPVLRIQISLDDTVDHNLLTQCIGGINLGLHTAAYGHHSILVILQSVLFQVHAYDKLIQRQNQSCKDNDNRHKNNLHFLLQLSLRKPVVPCRLLPACPYPPAHTVILSQHP